VRDLDQSQVPLVVANTKPLTRPPLPSNTGNSSGNPLFIDTFDYAVARTDAGGIAAGGAALTAFTNAGWALVKRLPTDTGSRGWIYTTTSIAGYSGQMPGLSGNGRVLCLEGAPTSSSPAVGSGVNNQTDFYLRYGTAGSANIPGDHWYQFWFYINDSGAEQSRWSDGSKFLYPSPPDDDYPVATGNLPYLWNLGRGSYETDGTAWNNLSYGSSMYAQNRPQYSGSTGADFSGASEYPTNRDKLGSNQVAKTTGYFAANNWYLIKLHFDNSGVQGTYEMWVRSMNGEFQKRAEWIGGVTTDFVFPTVTGHRGGVASVLLPSTWGVANDTDTTNYDAWVYLSDFAIASSEADLPTYGSY